MSDSTTPLSGSQREALLRSAPECTFIWSRRDGWPVGVTMGFLFERERFWLITGADRPRVAAVRRDPRASIVVSDEGQTLTAFGRCHVDHDADTRSWAYQAFAARQAELFPDLIDADAFRERMVRLEQIVIEVPVERWLTYDGSKAPLR